MYVVDQNLQAHLLGYHYCFKNVGLEFKSLCIDVSSY
jgi:hypothetical protein